MNKKFSSLILGIISFIFALIAVIFFSGPFVTLKLGYLAKEFSGFQFLFDFDKQYLAEGGNSFGLWISFFIAIFICAGGLGTVIGELIICSGKTDKQNQKFEQTSYNGKRMAYEQRKKTGLFTGIGGIVICIIALIINLCSVNMTGYGDNNLASLGTGAIWSAVLLMISSVVSLILRLIALEEPVKVTNNSENKLNQTTVHNIVKTQSSTKNTMDELSKLNDLKKQGLITEDEYNEKKKQLLK